MKHLEVAERCALTRRLRYALASLTRVTSSGKYLAEVDGLRFLAVFAVFVFHVRAYLNGKSSIAWRVPIACDWLADLTLHGDYGVPLFFGISGFVVALPFAEHFQRGEAVISLRPYYLRRMTRLAPPYVASIVGFCVLLALVKHLPAHTLAPHAAASALYVHGLVYATPNIINVVAWSLEIEIQFYLVAPLLARVFLIRSPLFRRTLLCVAGYAVIVLQPWLVDGDARLRLTLLGALQYFLVGFVLADLHVARPPKSLGAADVRRAGRILSAEMVWDLAAAVGWPAMILLCRIPFLVRLFFPPLMLLLFFASFRSRFFRRLLTMRALTAIGGMCYSIYLIHYQVISLVGRITVRFALTRDFWVNLLLQAVLLSAPVMLASCAFFLLVERPCMRRDWPVRLLAWARFGAARPERAAPISPSQKASA